MAAAMLLGLDLVLRVDLLQAGYNLCYQVALLAFISLSRVRMPSWGWLFTTYRLEGEGGLAAEGCTLVSATFALPFFCIIYRHCLPQ